MKKAVVFLAAALLVLGSALPLAGYWLAKALLEASAPAPAARVPSGAGSGGASESPAPPPRPRGRAAFLSPFFPRKMGHIRKPRQVSGRNSPSIGMAARIGRPKSPAGFACRGYLILRL